MIANEIQYEAPRSVQEALRALASAGESKVIAGGHSLIPLMKLGLARPTRIVDIGRIDELKRIQIAPGAVIVGAAVTHEAIADDENIKQRFAALAEAAQEVGDMQVRSRGTIGGSLAHADPAADEPAAVLALDATILAAGPKGERAIPARDFFVGTFTTALRPDEILTAVSLPTPPARTGSAYVKFPHPASKFAVVGVAAVITVAADGKIARAAIAVAGASDRAYRADAAERALTGSKGDTNAIAAAATKATDGVTINADLVADVEYRSHLVAVFTRRAVERAIRRATG